MSNQPVAWHYPGGKPDQCTTDKAYAEMEPAWTPMFYKNELVGLTEEEVRSLVNVAVAAERKRIVDLLLDMHAKEERHNYFLFIANLIKESEVKSETR